MKATHELRSVPQAGSFQSLLLEENTLQVTYTNPEFHDDPEKGHRLTTTMFVPLPIENVFEFFSDANQLERITPPRLSFKILTPSIELREGALLDYQLKLRGFPIKWRTEICVWDPPNRFVDQQLRGPYHRWYHQHTFESTDGGTNVYDDVHYIVPLGKIVERLFVRKELKGIFAYRQEQLQIIFNEQVAARA